MDAAKLAKEVFGLVDAQDIEGFLGYMTEDVGFRFANAPAISGKEQVRKVFGKFMGSIKGLEHEIINTWAQENAIICQGEVTYTRKDSSGITLPYVTIWHMQAEFIKEYLIYIDQTPLYAGHS